MELRGPFPQERGGPFSTEGGIYHRMGGIFEPGNRKNLTANFIRLFRGIGGKGAPESDPPQFPPPASGNRGKNGGIGRKGEPEKTPGDNPISEFLFWGGPEKRPGAAQVAKNPESGNRKKLTTPLPKIPHCFGVSGGEMGFFRNRIAGGGLVLRVAIIYLYRASRN